MRCQGNRSGFGKSGDIQKKHNEQEIMLIGHQKIWQFLKKSAELEKLPHALLFSGQEKLGKKTLAIEFAKWLLGEDIQKRQHPDFIFISAEKKDFNSASAAFFPRTSIQISQIRDLNWRISLKPSLNSFKIAIIDQAHLMTSEAQNAFLKILEEPKGKTLLILVTEYPELIFPTLLSRVQKIKFSSVKISEIEDYLRTRKVPEKKIKEIIKLSLGKPGIAVDFISYPKKLEERDRKIKELIEILNSNLACRLQKAKDLAKRTNLKEVLNVWLSFFRQILISKINQQFSEFDFGQFKYPREYSLAKLKNTLKLIEGTNFFISTTNVNPRLALEILMIELEEEGF